MPDKFLENGRSDLDLDIEFRQYLQKRNKLVKLSIILAIIVLVIILFFVFSRGKEKTSNTRPLAQKKVNVLQSEKIDKLEFSPSWKSVLLSNGQVYFGKLSSSENNFIKLDNVYYIQPNSNQKKKETMLSKLGKELHMPLNAMVINPDNLVYYQDIKDKSNVVKAIKEYEKEYKEKEEEVKSDGWHAVFLNNNSVYFGKLTFLGSVAKLSNSSYLKFKNSKKTQNLSKLTLDDLILQPVEADPQGATSDIFIFKNQIIFYEILSDKSPVVKALTKE